LIERPARSIPGAASRLFDFDQTGPHVRLATGSAMRIAQSDLDPDQSLGTPWIII